MDQDNSTKLKLSGPGVESLFSSLTKMLDAATDALVAYARCQVAELKLQEAPGIQELRLEVLRKELQDKKTGLDRKKQKLENEVKNLEARKTRAAVKPEAMKSGTKSLSPEERAEKIKLRLEAGKSEREKALTHKPFEGLSLEINTSTTAVTEQPSAS